MGIVQFDGKKWMSFIGPYGDVRYAELGPAEPISVKNRILKLTERLERQGKTDTSRYRMLQAEANKYLNPNHPED